MNFHMLVSLKYFPKVSQPHKILSISIFCQGFSYQEGWGLVQTGGYNHIDGSATNDEDTVDFSNDGDSWDSITTKIPDGLNLECVARF